MEDTNMDDEQGWQHAMSTANADELWKTIAEVRSQSADVSELMVALAKAQGAIGDITRDRVVTVRSQKGSYQFKYATLSNIIRGIKKALSDNGIAYTQVLTWHREDRLYFLTTNLHCKNQFISSVTPLISSGHGNQEFGSALTYMKRYALAALVGVAAEEDDDGNIADGNEVQAMQEPGRKAAPVVAPDPIVPAQAVGGEPPTALALGKIDVPQIDGNPDWVTWGRNLIAAAKNCASISDLNKLQDANEIPLKNMETYAPKMYANLSVSLLKVRKSLEKPDAE